jgi:ribonuclease E
MPTEAGENGKSATGQFTSENGKAVGDSNDDDEKSEAERRRRRGRRGGRRRAHREAGFEPTLDEPRAAPELVEVLPIPGVEEREPVVVEAVASAPLETPGAAIEPVGPHEFASETYNRSRDAEIARESEPAAPEPIAAIHEVHAERPAATRDETPGWVSLYPRPSDAPGGERAVGGSPAMRPAETSAAVRGESEPPSPKPSAEVAPPPSEPSPVGPSPVDPGAVSQVGEKPANPRRGWWQRLMQS